MLSKLGHAGILKISNMPFKIFSGSILEYNEIKGYFADFLRIILLASELESTHR